MCQDTVKNRRSTHRASNAQTNTQLTDVECPETAAKHQQKRRRDPSSVVLNQTPYNTVLYCTIMLVQ